MSDETNDLKAGFEAIADKQMEHTKRWRYYDGDHPIAFVNPKISEVIKNGVVFKKNWCEVIIRTVRDRLEVMEWDSETEGGADRMGEIWKRVLYPQALDVHTAVLTTGEGYLLAWPDATGNLRAYAHDPRNVAVLYMPDDPQTPRVGVKRWSVGKVQYMNLYYPDRIEHYVANTEQPYSYSAYRPAEVPVERNIYGTIPLFHFRLNNRVMTGELTKGILSLQDALNKLLNDMMVASEYSSFAQRWAIGNLDATDTTIGPGSFLIVPPGIQGEQPTSLGAFPTTPPGNYLEPLGAITNDMAALSGTPRHYFEGQGANISGEALQTMEGPLVAKVQQYQGVLGATWEQVMAFAMAVEGQRVDAKDIECIWKPPHTQQPKTAADTRLVNVQAGIPIINQLRDEGWTEEQLDQLREDQAATPSAAQPGQAPSPATNNPQTPEQAAPRFNGAVRTPDIAGQLASTGAISRAINRRTSQVTPAEASN